MKKFLLLTLLLVFIQTSAKATLEGYNASSFGDFSSRSLIMQYLDGNKEENRITQEQKDVLKSKKLSPDVACLIAQIKKRNIDNVELLVRSKVNLNTSYLTEYPILVASRVNDFEIVKLLYENGAKLDKGMYSELFEAIRNKNSEMAMFFIENGAKLNYIDSFTSNSALYFALKNNMIEVASEMIKRKAYVNNRTFALIKKKNLTHLLEN